MARFSGRAPNCGSYPSLARYFRAAAVNLDGQLLLGQPLFQTLQLNADNRRNLFLVQAVENDDVVNPVEEFGPEIFLQFRPDHLLDFPVLFPLRLFPNGCRIPG